MRPVDTTLTLAATAGDVVGEIANTTGEAQEILFGTTELTTDATVANRWVRLSLYDADDNVFATFHTGAAVTASLTVGVDYLQGIFRETSIVDGVLQVPIPQKAVLPSGWALKITVANGVAGDSYIARFYVREVRE